MIAARVPIQRPIDAKVLVVDTAGAIAHRARTELAQLLRPGDVLIANDAATIPASLSGTHLRTRQAIEVRLAGRSQPTTDGFGDFMALIFGAGDFRTPTEHRRPPPAIRIGDALRLGPLSATVIGGRAHPRLVDLRFDGPPSKIWHGLARHGRPIQYSHLDRPLDIWDTWTAIAAAPTAFEPPSAGFVLEWGLISSLESIGVWLGTLTHAAGISSTGDPALDSRLPFDEPYRIPKSTADLIGGARRRAGRVIAVGTSVVRALEHSATRDGSVRWGESVATQRIGRRTPLRVVDALVTGVHEQGTSHHELLRAFVDDRTHLAIDQQLDDHHYRSHEFGDSVFIERMQNGGSRLLS